MLTPITVFTFLATLTACAIVGRGPRLSTVLYVAIAVYHMVFLYLFLDISADSGSDANYYYNALPHDASGVPISTNLIIAMAIFMRDSLGASIFEEFVVFQFFGFMGIVILIDSLQEFFSANNRWKGPVILAVSFSPGLHFWTVSINKDGLTLLGLSLILRGLVYLKRGKLQVVLGAGLVFVARPHVGMIEIGAVIISTMILSTRASAFTRLVATAGGLTIMVFGFVFVVAFYGISNLTLDDLGAYVDKLQVGNQSASSAVDINSLIFPVRILAFLLLPLFFDAQGLSALVLSVENLLILILLTYCAVRWRQLLVHARQNYVVGFCMVAFPVATAVLTLGSTNVGLAARQKMMVVPMLPFLFAAAGAPTRNSAQRHVPAGTPAAVRTRRAA